MSISTRAVLQSKLEDLLNRQNEQAKERDSLYKRIVELDISIAETKLEYAKTHNYLPTILGLPNEITTSIFGHACDGEDQMEVRISHVCHIWRSTALAYSALWAKFLYRKDCKSKAHNTEVDRLSSYLTRSGSRLLDLHFVLPDSFFGDVTSKIRALLEKATEHVSRWRRFSLVMPADASDSGRWMDGEVLASFEHLSSPHLQLFKIFLPLDPRTVRDKGPSSLSFRCFKGGAPQLSYLKMDARSFITCIPPSNVTTLEIQQQDHPSSLYPFQRFLDLLGSSTLTTLIVKGSIFSSPPPDLIPRRSLPSNLKNLYCSDTLVVCHIWSLLNAPHLELMVIKNVCLHGYWVFPPDLEAPEHRSLPFLPSVRTLVLINCEVDLFNCASSLASATQSITHLYIVHNVCCNDTDDLFSQMALQSSNVTLWPHLETLTCAVTRRYELPASVYRSAWQDIERRSQNYGKHLTIRLYGQDAGRWKHNDLNSWEALEEAGHFQEIPQTATKWWDHDPLECVPWPPPEFQHYDISSGDVFG